MPVKNAVKPSEKVGKAERITAEVILSTGGKPVCDSSPAPWVEESLRTIDISVPHTKELIITVKQGIFGYWEMDSKGIPIGNRVGELKIRILQERDSVTTQLAMKRYRWKRAPALSDFTIEELS